MKKRGAVIIYAAIADTFPSLCSSIENPGYQQANLFCRSLFRKRSGSVTNNVHLFGSTASAAFWPFVLCRLHYPIDIIVQCVRWYLAYSLSLHNLEEMIVDRGIVVGHSTLYRWVIRLVPLLDKAFRRRKRTVGQRWRMDETDINVKGQWKYLYRAVDTAGQTMDFLLTAKRDDAALRIFRKAVRHHGEPEVISNGEPARCRDSNHSGGH